MTPVDLEFALRQFTGTENYHRWSVLFRNFVMTDGAKYLAENAGAYCLMSGRIDDLLKEPKCTTP